MLDLYFYDVWLWLDNFSKLIKIGVNLRVPNWWVFRIPVKYVNEKSQIPSPNLELLARFAQTFQVIFTILTSIIFGSTPKSAKGSVRLWESIQRKKGEIPLDKIQFIVEFGKENRQISGWLHFSHNRPCFSWKSSCLFINAWAQQSSFSEESLPGQLWLVFTTI